MTSKRIASSLLIAYWIVLFLGTHIPIYEENVPHVARVLGGIIPLDKVVHFSGYFVLALLMAWTWIGAARPRLSALLAILLLASVYGALDEASQVWVVTRHADVMDWVANTAGAATGVAAYAVGHAAWFGRRPRSPRDSGSSSGPARAGIPGPGRADAPVKGQPVEPRAEASRRLRAEPAAIEVKREARQSRHSP